MSSTASLGYIMPIGGLSSVWLSDVRDRETFKRPLFYCKPTIEIDGKEKYMIARLDPKFMKHVLPKGFRRTRNFGFLHPNSKNLIALLQVITGIKTSGLAWLRERAKFKCQCCGGLTKIIRTRIRPQLRFFYESMMKIDKEATQVM